MDEKTKKIYYSSKIIELNNQLLVIDPWRKFKDRPVEYRVCWPTGQKVRESDGLYGDVDLCLWCAGRDGYIPRVEEGCKPCKYVREAIGQRCHNNSCTIVTENGMWLRLKDGPYTCPSHYKEREWHEPVNSYDNGRNEKLELDLEKDVYEYPNKIVDRSVWASNMILNGGEGHG